MTHLMSHYMQIRWWITCKLHDVLPVELHILYMVLHVSKWITQFLQNQLHACLHVQLHAILQDINKWITCVLQDITKESSPSSPAKQLFLFPPNSYSVNNLRLGLGVYQARKASFHSYGVDLDSWGSFHDRHFQMFLWWTLPQINFKPLLLKTLSD
jgi:hypothetical protein